MDNQDLTPKQLIDCFRNHPNRVGGPGPLEAARMIEKLVNERDAICAELDKKGWYAHDDYIFHDKRVSVLEVPVLSQMLRDWKTRQT